MYFTWLVDKGYIYLVDMLQVKWDLYGRSEYVVICNDVRIMECHLALWVRGIAIHIDTLENQGGGREVRES